ncbi:MAG: hypothetical protein KC484_05890 [Colwelliaceae bacterium]|nr:hypothetical protein [Colwelliaceae bacterium]
MDNVERPFPLLIVVALYFLFGLSAVVSLFSAKPTDLMSISLLFISYGLLTKKSWALIGFKVVVSIQILAMAFMLLMQLLPGDGGTAQIGLGSFEFSISPFLFNIIFIAYVGFQSYVAFSKETTLYITNT